MSKPILISCDSACDLSPELKEQYGIQITSMYVHEGERTFRDGVDITPDDIYRIYENEGILPKTSAIPPEEYAKFFRSYTDQGYAVVHIALSSGFRHLPGCHAGRLGAGGRICAGLPGT